mgnify:FL=1
MCDHKKLRQIPEKHNNKTNCEPAKDDNCQKLSNTSAEIACVEIVYTEEAEE